MWNFILCSLLCVIYYVQFTLWNLLCAIYLVQFTLWNLLCGIYYLQYVYSCIAIFLKVSDTQIFKKTHSSTHGFHFTLLSAYIKCAPWVSLCYVDRPIDLDIVLKAYNEYNVNILFTEQG